jgi:hypothetical protein
MKILPTPNLESKTVRIGLHLGCLCLPPLAHAGFHLSGIARELWIQQTTTGKSH